MKPSKELENNQFQFHLDQLLGFDYVEKKGNKYKLTSRGKEYANRIDTDDIKVKPQAKISVWIACSRVRKGKTQYLIGTRLKQPFYGCQGFMSGKVQYGETLAEAAKRELKEEANLKGNPEVVAIVHYRVFESKSQRLVEDKFMHLCIVKNPKGKLISNEEGFFEWIDQDEIKKQVKNPFENIDSLLRKIEMIERFDGRIKLIEEDHVSKKF